MNISKTIFLFLVLFSINSFSVYLSAILDKPTNIWTLSCDNQRIKLNTSGNVLESNFKNYKIEELQDVAGIVITFKLETGDYSVTLFCKDNSGCLNSALLFNVIQQPQILRTFLYKRL